MFLITSSFKLRNLATSILFISTLLISAPLSSVENKNETRLNKEQINNLFLLAKVWGFLKYFHPEIREGKIDIDQVLLAGISEILGSQGSRYDINRLLSKFSNKISPNNNPPNKIDEVIIENDVKLTVCGHSMMFLMGTKIDWQEDIMGSIFVFDNPNAKSQCGCGTSFGIG